MARKHEAMHWNELRMNIPLPRMSLRCSLGLELDQVPPSPPVQTFALDLRASHY